MEKKLTDARLVQKMLEEAASESRDRAEAAKSIIGFDEMTDEIWEKFIKDVYVYPGERLDIQWNFDE